MASVSTALASFDGDAASLVAICGKKCGQSYDQVASELIVWKQSELYLVESFYGGTRRRAADSIPW